MGTSEWLAIIGIIVGIIGIVVGVIGIKGIRLSNKYIIKTKGNSGGQFQQAQVIHNGLDSFAVIKLARDITEEEFKKAIISFSSELSDIKTELDKKPNMHVGPEQPKNMKIGHMWIHTSKKDE